MPVKLDSQFNHYGTLYKDKVRGTFVADYRGEKHEDWTKIGNVVASSQFVRTRALICEGPDASKLSDISIDYID